MKSKAVEIVRILREAGHEACFAGGCVRDLLRGVEPKDYDIATSARPPEIKKLFPRAGEVGAHFGVMLVKRGEHFFEIATFREDGTYHDGRRPDSVTFSTAEADAKRRDFTINGMFYDPLADEVVDHVGGRADLGAKLIRAIGTPANRFDEDYLRLLRAVRFATVLGFEIETETWAAIRQASDRVSRISPERIREELDKIWFSPNRITGFDLLVAGGLMKAVLPEILDLQGCEQPPQFHPEGDVFVHTRLMLSLLPPDASLTLVLAVLLHDIAKPATQTRDPDGRIRFNGHEKLGAELAGSILKRLRYSNAVIEKVVNSVLNHMRFKDVTQMRTSTLKRFMARDNFEEELALHRIDCLGSNGILSNHEFLVAKQQEFSQAPLLPKWFLSGNDLVARGWPSGPEIGEVITRSHDLQLEGVHQSREEALAWLAGVEMPEDFRN